LNRFVPYLILTNFKRSFFNYWKRKRYRK